jgi:hypothetical protein
LKSDVSPVAMIIAVVVALVICGFVGFHFLHPPKPASANPNAPKGMSDEQRAQYEQMHTGHGGGPSSGGMQSMSGSPGSGGMQGNSGGPMSGGR